MHRSPVSIYALVVLCALAACSGTPASSSALAPTASAESVPAQPQTGGDDVLYVANTLYYPQSVSVYNGPKLDLLRTITEHVDEPAYLALDSAGHLYVSNLQKRDPEAVTEFADKGSRFVGTISHQLKPGPLTVNAANSLYVLRRRSVSIYVAAGKKRHLHTVKVRNGDALTVDAAGNLYVGTLSTNIVYVFPPGGSTPTRTITDGIFDPSSLAVDSAGNLYVANAYGGNDYCNNRPGGTVTVYGPGSSSVLYTITAKAGICVPGKLALDAANNLYVANGPPGSETLGSVTVYAPGGKFLRAITLGIDAPDGLVLDASGNVFVANAYADTVTEYQAGTSKLIRTISEGVKYPEAIAVGK